MPREVNAAACLLLLLALLRLPLVARSVWAIGQASCPINEGRNVERSAGGSIGDRDVASRTPRHLLPSHASATPPANAADSPPSLLRLWAAGRGVGVNHAPRRGFYSNAVEIQVVGFAVQEEYCPIRQRGPDGKAKSPTQLLDSLLLSGYDARIRPNFNAGYSITRLAPPARDEPGNAGGVKGAQRRENARSPPGPPTSHALINSFLPPSIRAALMR
ncbi:Hypp112 [Branchiostoma lanceolatum]|uniref:Hypp112 protein n=1 Tax=Branchiostoma lanceolatum TaxID=7740 RepID=A0A8J9YHM1_BRALA|nr:Hypp112 [Branchiostoma lanceolatum]